MTELVPLSAVPSQAFNVSLGNQRCRISLYQRTTGLYFDLLINDEPIIVGVLCLDQTLLVRDVYLRFNGDLAFFDLLNEGVNPSYEGLGTRFELRYFNL